MPIFDLSGGFNVTARDPIDTRLVLSKEEMKNADVNLLPKKKSYYFAFCKDDQSWYYYNASNADNPETGKYLKMASGGSTPSTESGPVADRPSAEDGKPGDKWYDPETGKTYIIIADSEGNQSWVEVTPEPGEMMYDSTNNVILYFDGTQWKPIGGVTKVESLSSEGEEGEIVYDESTNQYKVFEDGVWLTLAKT